MEERQHIIQYHIMLNIYFARVVNVASISTDLFI
jgi:hypothetical protein